MMNSKSVMWVDNVFLLFSLLRARPRRRGKPL